MKTKIVVASLAAGALVLSGASSQAVGKGKSGPKVLGTDDAGDWGANAEPALAPLGDVLGQDLVEASMGMSEDGKDVNFIIKVNALPPTGGIPESSRYTWDFSVDGSAFQLSGAFTEYVRGVCNPLHTGACPPPQDPGSAPFFLRHGPCNVGADCFVDHIAHATFDASEGTITIPVPLEVLGAKPGSKIAPGATSFGGTIYAAPALLVAQASLPNDTMIILKTYKVPKSKK